MCRKYPPEGGQADSIDRQPDPQPLQQSSHGAGVPKACCIAIVGVQQMPTSMCRIVQGEGAKAMSLPPTEIITMSFASKLSLSNLSCGRRAPHERWRSMVASTAVLMQRKCKLRAMRAAFKQ